MGEGAGDADGGVVVVEAPRDEDEDRERDPLAVVCGVGCVAVGAVTVDRPNPMEKNGKEPSNGNAFAS